MSKAAHRIFLTFLVIIVAGTLIILVIKGTSYYRTVLEERAFHPDHENLKPSGIVGHGLGIAGTLFMIIGIVSYMARKRFRSLSRMGLLKHWLEFHIFLCTLGPLMVLFHTAFKFGGLVAVSFWSMVAVFLSGIVGRFIYIQIPRSIEGRELSLSEVREMRNDLAGILKSSYSLDEENYQLILESVKKKVGIYHKNVFIRYMTNRSEDRRSLTTVKKALKSIKLPGAEVRKILSLVKEDIKIKRRIERLGSMQNLFKFWHVAHLPFALVMLVIMVIHVSVTIIFGYRWIF